jgi:hypothetical protein
MYKSFKLTKRYGIAFNTFPKTAKTMKLKVPAYHTGICKSTDEINEFDTYFFVLGTFRIMWYVQHKHKCGVTHQ